MKRYIAILTLALTAGLSAVKSPAANPGVSEELYAGLVADVDHPDTLQWSIFADVDHPDTLSFSLIAIIAFEDSPEAAYEMLLDLGLSPAMAENMVLEAIAIYGVRRY